MVLGFLLVPVYTAVLTPLDYGIVEMMAVLGGVLAVVARLGIPGAVTRYYYEHSEGTGLRDYVTSIAWFLRINASVVGGVALIAGFLFMDLIAPGLDFYPYVPLAVVATMLTTNSELQRRLVQVRRQSSYSARLSVVKAFVAVGFAVTFVVFLRLGATGMLLGNLLTAGLFLANATLYLRPDLTGRVRPEAIRESLRYGRGIFASELLAAAGPFISRVILFGAASLGSVGLFALASRVVGPLTILGAAFSTAYTPEYFAARNDGSEAARDALMKIESGIWTLGVLGSLGAASLGPSAVVLLTPETFHGAAPLIPVLALGLLGQVLFALTSPEMFYAKRSWLPLAVTASNIAATVVVTLLLVRQYGAFGVAWGSVAGSVTGGVVCGLAARRVEPIRHDWLGLLRAPLLAGVTAAILLTLGTREPVSALLLGIAALVSNVLLLWIAGDPAIRRIVMEVRIRLFRSSRTRP